MPRHARIDHPGLLQHVIARGIEKRPIFLDDKDRGSFLVRVSKELQATNTDCFAWALMDNHVHLLLRPNKVLLADIMRRILTGHAVVFNKRHKRVGHLFQNRYKSIVCDQDNYLLELIRYIHLNPLRAGIVPNLKDLQSFQWCSHRELVTQGAPALIRSDEILKLFANTPKTARHIYGLFMEDGIGQSMPDLSKGGKRASLALDPTLSDDDAFDDRILGGGSFVEKLFGKKEAEETNSTITLQELEKRISAYYGIDPQLLRIPTKEREVAKCKAILCYLGLRHLRVAGTEIAALTTLSSSGVTRAAKRGENLLRGDKALFELFLK